MNLDRLRKLAERYPAVRRLLAPAAAARRYVSGHYQHERIAETLQVLLAEDPVLHVPSFEGAFSVDARSDIFRIILSLRDYEPRLARCCLDHIDPQRDALDLGANVGLYTVLMARHLAEGRRVLAVEPTANALRNLHDNIERNGVGDRVQVFEGVVSDYDGACTIQTIAGREEYSTIGHSMHPHVSGTSTEAYEVEAATLDALVERFSFDPGFMKVDVEGAEAMVFGGASNVLSEARPVVLSELSDYLLQQNGSSAADVIALFREHDYRVIDPLWPEHPVGEKRFGDILCIPHERA